MGVDDIRADICWSNINVCLVQNCIVRRVLPLHCKTWITWHFGCYDLIDQWFWEVNRTHIVRTCLLQAVRCVHAVPWDASIVKTIIEKYESTVIDVKYMARSRRGYSEAYISTLCEILAASPETSFRTATLSRILTKTCISMLTKCNWISVNRTCTSKRVY